MNSLFATAAALLLASTALADVQTSDTTQGTATTATTRDGKGQAGSDNPAVKDRDPTRIAAPAQGANSFTEDQAKRRLAEAGYQVASLTKQGNVWTGPASKAGKSVTVMLDYKGNITTR